MAGTRPLARPHCPGYFITVNQNVNLSLKKTARIAAVGRDEESGEDIDNELDDETVVLVLLLCRTIYNYPTAEK